MRVSIWGLMRFQLMLSPVLLGFFLYRNADAMFASLSMPARFVWLLGTPSAYAFLLTMFRILSRPPNSRVFGGLRGGVQYGILFAVLTWIPLIMWETSAWICFDLGPRIPIDGLTTTLIRAPGTIRPDIFQFSMMFLFWLVYGAGLGAFFGIAAGIVVGCFAGGKQPAMECATETSA